MLCNQITKKNDNESITKKLNDLINQIKINIKENINKSLFKLV